MPYIARKLPCDYDGIDDPEFEYTLVHNAIGEEEYDKLVAGEEIDFKDWITVERIEKSLRELGPLVLSVHSDAAFRFYTQGPFYSPDGCIHPEGNHAVVLIGMDKDFWYLQSSWGLLWGE